MNSLGHTHVQLTQLLDTRFWLSRQPDTGRRQPGSGTTGQYLARQHGQSTEFDQVRDYQPGDDSRHIDWRATARAGVVQTRLFHRERDRPVFIVVEQSPAMFFASQGNFKSVQAALAASLFAWAATSAHDRVGGLVFNGKDSQLTTPMRNQKGTLHLLHSICQANRALVTPFAASSGNPLLQALKFCPNQLRPESLLILVCSENHLDADVTSLLGALAAQYQNIWLPISDPLEHQLPTSQHLALAGRQGRLQLRHQHQLAHRWQQQASQVRAHWQQLAIRQRAVLLPLTTANSLAQQLASLQEGLRVAGA